jgi:uncharacterized protein
LLALWEATFDPRFLDEAERLAKLGVDLFGDEHGGFYTTTESLVVRQKEIVESATPAPGAVLSLVLQRVAALLDDREIAKPAIDAMRVTRVYMEKAAQAVTTWLSSLDFYVSTPKEIAFTGPIDGSLLGVVHSRYLPNRVMAARSDGIDTDIALLRDKPQTDTPTAYVCEKFVCKAPTSDPSELAAQLD